MAPINALDNVPHIASSTYQGTAYGLGAQGGLQQASAAMAGNAGLMGGTGHQAAGNLGLRRTDRTDEWDFKQAENRLRGHEQAILQAQAEEINMATSTNRFVRVLIVDPNENIPLDKRLVYKGEEKFTDSSDTELYFEIDIKSVLDAHNAYRVTVRDKKVKEREEFLEPVKIRDLKMVVVNIASF